MLKKIVGGRGVGGGFKELHKEILDVFPGLRRILENVAGAPMAAFGQKKLIY